jgi:kynurenine formamidase
MSRLIDLTQETYQGMQVYPGHLKTVVWRHHEHAETAGKFVGGFSYASMGVLLSDHGPTHVDAISHFDPSPGAASIDEMELRNFHGPGICLDLSNTPASGQIGADALDAAARESAVPLMPDMVVLLRTASCERWYGTPEYLTAYPGLDETGCEWLVSQSVRVFGVDSPSPDHPASPTYPVHMMCRAHGITHYEHLTGLDQLVNRPFYFYGLPLRLRGATASPVRAVAVVEDERAS